MVSQLVLQVGEQTVEGIGRVRDVQFLLVLEHEQMRHVADKAEVGTSESLVGVVGLPCLGVHAPFVKCVLPFLMPFLQLFCETRPRASDKA